MQVNTPFYNRFRDLRIGEFKFQPEPVAWVLTGIVAAALVVHGFGMKKTGRMDGGAPFEPIRKWDKEHPERSIGTYADSVTGGPVISEELTEENTHHPSAPADVMVANYEQEAGGEK